MFPANMVGSGTAFEIPRTKIVSSLPTNSKMAADRPHPPARVHLVARAHGGAIMGPDPGYDNFFNEFLDQS